MRFYEMYFVRNDEIKMLNQSINSTKKGIKRNTKNEDSH